MPNSRKIYTIEILVAPPAGSSQRRRTRRRSNPRCRSSAEVAAEVVLSLMCVAPVRGHVYAPYRGRGAIFLVSAGTRSLPSPYPGNAEPRVASPRNRRRPVGGGPITASSGLLTLIIDAVRIARLRLARPRGRGARRRTWTCRQHGGRGAPPPREAAAGRTAATEETRRDPMSPRERPAPRRTRTRKRKPSAPIGERLEKAGRERAVESSLRDPYP